MIWFGDANKFTSQFWFVYLVAPMNKNFAQPSKILFSEHWVSIVYQWFYGIRIMLFHMHNLIWYDILSISLFCKIALSLSIFFKIFLLIWISISIFSRKYISIFIFSRMTMSLSISISILTKSIPIQIFSKYPYQYFYRYQYFQKNVIILFSISIFQQ